MLIEQQARWVAAARPGSASSSGATRTGCPSSWTRTDHCAAVSAGIGPPALVPYGRLIREGDWWLVYCILFDSWSPFVYRLNDTRAGTRQLARAEIVKHHDHFTSERIRLIMLRLLTGALVAVILAVLLVRRVLLR